MNLSRCTLALLDSCGPRAHSVTDLRLDRATDILQLRPQNVRIPAGFNGYTACSLLRETAMKYGPVRSFRVSCRSTEAHYNRSPLTPTPLPYSISSDSILLRQAYMETELERHVRATAFRSAMQASGLTIADTPHNGGKEGEILHACQSTEAHLRRVAVADKQLIVDLFTFALDHPSATFVLVTGDKDFAYSCSTLRNRRYKVVIICPETRVHESLSSSCDEIIYWRTGVLQLPPLPLPLPQKRMHTDPAPPGKRLKQDYRWLHEQGRAHNAPPPYHQPHQHYQPHPDPHRGPPRHAQANSPPPQAVAGPSSAREADLARDAAVPVDLEAEEAMTKEEEVGSAEQTVKKQKSKKGDKHKRAKKRKARQIEVLELFTTDDEEEEQEHKDEERQMTLEPVPAPALVKSKTRGQLPGTPVLGRRRSSATSQAAASAASQASAEVSSDADDLIIVSSARKLRSRLARGSAPSKLALQAHPSSAMDTTVSSEEENDAESEDASSEERVGAMLVRGK